MQRAIVGYRVDEHDDWVADLDCGHGQHVRHRPPFVDRPWVVTREGRDSMLGTRLDCLRCDRMEFPEGLAAYRRTPVFDQDSIPAGLRRRHSTKAGVWGLIHVLEGRLGYEVDPPVGRAFALAAGDRAAVVPEIEHTVEPDGPVRFLVEFWRRSGPGDD